tara:strand:+ start:1233 stop:1406 length:174 start_codon:yes stop_codon:yes gene_type:complete
MKIRIIVDQDGVGQKGDILDVSDIRAERWCNAGFAELAVAAVEEAEEEPEETEEADD